MCTAGAVEAGLLPDQVQVSSVTDNADGPPRQVLMLVGLSWGLRLLQWLRSRILECAGDLAVLTAPPVPLPGPLGVSDLMRN